MFCLVGRSRKYDRNHNNLVVEGSGKAREYVEPNLIQLNSDYFVTDPKGTSFPNTDRVQEEAGCDIKVFNTPAMSASLCYSPLAYMRGEADILEFMECLITNATGDREHSGDPFWENVENYLSLLDLLFQEIEIGRAYVERVCVEAQSFDARALLPPSEWCPESPRLSRMISVRGFPRLRYALSSCVR